MREGTSLSPSSVLQVQHTGARPSVTLKRHTGVWPSGSAPGQDAHVLVGCALDSVPTSDSQLELPAGADLGGNKGGSRTWVLGFLPPVHLGVVDIPGI